MRHLLQSLKDGTTEIVDVPSPSAGQDAIVVATRASVISPGTERMLVEFGRAGLIDKARAQPDKVRQVIDKARSDGLAPTLDAVRSKLDAPIPLGYCQAGLVTEVGRHVRQFRVGDRVVTNGAHAQYVRVSPTLAARIPDGVSFEAAAFAPLAAIALQGLRLAEPTLGETVVVYGLGLVGLLSVQLARAAGCHVIGIDRSSARVELAERFGARGIEARADVDVAAAVLAATGDVGADAVLLTLASDSADPVHVAAQMSRKRGRLVLVGVTGLHLRRDDFYRKELTFQVSCSYGPGRYDPSHEDRGVDYPLPFVRWTEGRNFEAVLSLMADGRLDPLPLISDRLPFDDAPAAYDQLVDGNPLGVVLTYDHEPLSAPARTVALSASGRPTAPSVEHGGGGTIGCLGAGNYASRVLVPAFRRAGASLDVIASGGGVSAAVVGRKQGFRRASTDAAAVVADPAIDTLVVATRHDSHADWVVRGLAAGKHVFVEKPLALTEADLDRIEAAAREAGRVLCVGFNRRFAPTVRAVRERVANRRGPAAVTMLVNAGAIPSDHWTQDLAVGGRRIVGEACHFIDLARAIVGAPIVDVVATPARRPDGAAIDDVAALQMAFADGSVASVQYFANGNRGFPKERVEVFADGMVFQIDNLRRVRAWGAAVATSRWPFASQDKGQERLAGAFLDAVRGKAAPPIPVDELIEVSRWSVRAAAQARS